MKLNQLVIKRFILTGTLILLLNTIVNQEMKGQTPPPPPPPPNSGANNGHNLGGNQGAPGAPIGGGLEILIGLTLLYAGKKIYRIKHTGEKPEQNG